MLTLPIKGKWFDMILSREKREEYREIKPYWIRRFENAFRAVMIDAAEGKRVIPWAVVSGDGQPVKEIPVRLRCGYSGQARSAVARCRLRVGRGRPEWGAEPGKDYLILDILEVREEPKKPKEAQNERPGDLKDR